MNLSQLIERLKQIEQEAINKGLDCSKIEVSLNAGESIVVAKQSLSNGRQLGALICFN